MEGRNTVRLEAKNPRSVSVLMAKPSGEQKNAIRTLGNAISFQWIYEWRRGVVSLCVDSRRNRTESNWGKKKKKIHISKNAHVRQDKAAVCYRARQLSHLEIDKRQQEGNMARQKDGEIARQQKSSLAAEH